MSSTPIDVVAHEHHEAYEDVFARVTRDRHLTDEEMIELGAAWAELTASKNELCGTVSHIRRASHAGVSSAWVNRKATEHARDVTGTKTNPDPRQRIEALVITS